MNFFQVMGLLRIIRKVKRREKEMRLLMLGLDNAGKTTILMRFVGEPIEGIPPTVGFNIKTVPNFQLLPSTQSSLSATSGTSGNSSQEISMFKLNIWDVGGQRSIRTFWRNYFEQTDGLIWVVDSADTFRLNDCKKELHALLTEERLAGASLLVLANKQDLKGAATVQEISDILEFDKIQKTGRHCAIFPCSAYSPTPELIHSAFQWVVKDVATRVYHPQDQNSFSQESPNPEQTKILA